ncbi:TetR/AcrR family transcriptional regulator [Pseudonocardia sp. CA-107938]|uniref:TetR/AcrR family transcriptional regulator n=1 Tax=Pseudonocardia sp. CA-107938 TaxID=3240021 RepID=UPI003D8FFDA0
MTIEESAAQSSPTRAYGTGREALLAAAIRVVAKRGLRHLTYRAVAEEAGVTHGLVTYHFGTREALLAEALHYSLDRSVPGLSDAPGSGRIESLFTGLTNLVESEPDTQAFQYELILESRRNPTMRPLVRELYDAYRSTLRAELAAAGLDGDALTHLVFAALDGLVFQQICAVNDVPTDSALEQLRQILATMRDRARQSSGDD